VRRLRAQALPQPDSFRHCYVGSQREKVTTVDERDWLAERFQAHRPHLRAVGYRMLGSLSEADDAVQGAWLRLSRSGTDTSEVHNLGGWLTTLVARECLDMLRARTARREEPAGMRLPDPVVSQDTDDPEQEALLAEGVGLALLVVLDTLGPAERLAFVLHDMFAVPFDEIGPLVGRSPAAAKMLASRARRRVHGAAVPDADPARQREIVEAFFAAARGGDFDALVAVLDPDAVVRADSAPEAGVSVVRGADAVAGAILARGGFARPGSITRPALVNGTAGVVITTARGRPIAVVGFTVRLGKVTEIDLYSNPARLRRLRLT
jgi:RNA polymerase sigma factor (sigma-70 family)